MVNLSVNINFSDKYYKQTTNEKEWYYILIC